MEVQSKGPEARVVVRVVAMGDGDDETMTSNTYEMMQTKIKNIV